MAAAALISPKIASGYLMLSTVEDGIDWQIDQVTHRITNFASGGFEQYTGGLKSLKLNATGFLDWTAGSIDEWNRVNAANPTVFSCAPVGDATGSICAFTKTLTVTDDFLIAKVGDVPTFHLDFQPQGTPVVEGQVTSSSTATITATGNSTSVQVGAPSASQTVYAAIHVLSITGTATPTLTAQLASGATSGGAFTTRGSAGTGLTAIGTQWFAVAGAQTDTWWRLNFTVTGTTPVFTILASIGIV